MFKIMKNNIFEYYVLYEEKNGVLEYLTQHHELQPLIDIKARLDKHGIESEINVHAIGPTL